MKNLQIINYQHKVILILFFIFSLISFHTQGSENRIIFKINDIAFTLIDYEKRVKYLEFVGNNNNLDKQTIIDDFISANIFFEYFKNSNNRNDYDEKIIKIYNDIKEINKNNNKIISQNIDEKIILQNIKIDYIRKIILEKILNSNIDSLNNSKLEIDLLYRFIVKYINFKNEKNIKNKINELENVDSDNIIELLDKNKINYFIKEKEVNNINKIDNKIKNQILSNKKSLIVQNGNNISLIFIDKQFETLEGIVANLYSVKSDTELDNEFLLCDNLLANNNSNIINKEYNFENLNNELKRNLISINDKVKYENNDEIIYIVLCNIKFDKEKLNSLNLNKLININVNDIEKRFISKYSKIYNLIRINE